MKNKAFIQLLESEEKRLSELLVKIKELKSSYLKTSSIHIGLEIKYLVESSSMTVAEFAKKLDMTRDGAYKIFEKSDISTGLLHKISIVLNHDFFKYYSETLNCNLKTDIE